MRLRKSLSAFYCSVPETLVKYSSARAGTRGVPETLMTHSSARARSRAAPETQTNHVRAIKEE